MAEEQYTPEEQVNQEVPVEVSSNNEAQSSQPPYRKQVYDLLSSKFTDFKRSEKDFYHKIDTESDYAGKVWETLKDKFSDFTRPQDEFLNLIKPVVKKKDGTQDSSTTSNPSSPSLSSLPSGAPSLDAFNKDAFSKGEAETKGARVWTDEDFKSLMESGKFNVAKSDNTRYVKPQQEATAAMDVKEAPARAAKKESDINTAINNAASRYFQSKGILTHEGSAIFNQQVAKLKQQLADGNAVVGRDSEGNLGLKGTVNFLQAFPRAIKTATKSEDDAATFVHSMTPEQRVKFYETKVVDKDHPEYIGEKNTAGGDIGELAGGALPFLAKATVGTLAGTAMVAAAPESAGASLVGLPAVMSFVLTAPDAANQGSMKEIIKRYEILRTQNPNMPKVEAMAKASSGTIPGEVEGLVTNALFTNTSLKLGPETKTVLGSAIKHAVNSGLHASASTTASAAVGIGVRNAQGYEQRPDQIGSELGNIITNNFTTGILLSLTHQAVNGGIVLPKVVSSAVKYGLKDIPSTLLKATLQTNIDLGNITKFDAAKTMEDIEGYKEALNKTVDGLTPEAQASVAGLTQAKTKLEQEAATKDKTSQGAYKQKIDAIDTQIKNIIDTGDVYGNEVNEVTGQSYSEIEGDVINASKPIEKQKEDLKYSIDQIESEYNKLKDSFIKNGAPIEEATKLADKEFNEKDKAALDKLKNKLSELEKNNPTEDDVIKNFTQDEKKQYIDHIVNGDESAARGMVLDKMPKFSVSDNTEVKNGFYSPIENTVNQLQQNRGTGEQMLAMIKKGKNITKDELEYTGIEQWLKEQKSVTKGDILNYIKDNRIEINDVVKGAIKTNWEEQDGGLVAKVDDGYAHIYTDKEGSTYLQMPNTRAEKLFLSEEDAKDYVDQHVSEKNGSTKYDKYTLPGGENYKEVLITKPVEKTNPESNIIKIVHGVDFINEPDYIKSVESNGSYFEVNTKDGARFNVSKLEAPTAEEAKQYTIDDMLDYNKERYLIYTKGDEKPSTVFADSLDEAKKSYIDRNTEELGSYKSSHYSEKNILAHLRMNTRVDAEGNKVLHLEEVQSDWGQAGKKQGFRNKEAEKELDNFTKKLIKEFGSDEWWDEKKVGEENWRKLNDLQKKSYADVNMLESAPYVTKTDAWVKLSLKKALQEAVAQGVDKVSWTTGEQQGERYSLAKQVDEVQYNSNGDGTYNYSLIKDGNDIGSRENATLEIIEKELGKDVAKRMNTSEGEEIQTPEDENVKSLKGDNLSVGGQGMKSFYGEGTQGGMVGKVFKQLVKDLTGKEGVINEATIGEDKQPSIEITPELKAAVQEGLPQFRLSSTDSAQRSEYINNWAKDVDTRGVAGETKIVDEIKDNILNTPVPKEKFETSDRKMPEGVSIEPLTVIGHKEIEGKTYSILQSDHLGVLEVEGEFQMGGVLFPQISFNVENGIVWAVDAPNVVTSMVNAAKKTGGRVLITLSGADANMSNRSLYDIWLKSVEEKLTGNDGKQFVEAFKTKLEALSKTKNTTITPEVLKESGKIKKVGDVRTFMDGIDNMGIRAEITKNTVPERGVVHTADVQRIQSEAGVKTYQDVIDQTSEPLVKGAQAGDIIAVLELDIDRHEKQGSKTYQELGLGDHEHQNYKYPLFGKVVGYLDSHVNVINASSDLMNTFLADAKVGDVKEGRINKRGTEMSLASAKSNTLRTTGLAKTVGDTGKPDTLSETSHTPTKIFATLVSKSFPNVELIHNQNEFDGLIEKNLGDKLSNKESKVYGVFYDGKVYLNPALDNFNTPVHEYSHVWLDVAEKERPEVYKKGIDLLNSDEVGNTYRDIVLNNNEYKNAIKDMKRMGATDEEVDAYVNKEALASLIGDKGEAFVKAFADEDGNIAEDKKSVYAKMIEWVNSVYNYVKDALSNGNIKSFGSMSAEEFSNLTLGDFANSVVGELLGNEKVSDMSTSDLRNGTSQPKFAAGELSSEERANKLQELLDKGLISQEEFDSSVNEIKSKETPIDNEAKRKVTMQRIAPAPLKGQPVKNLSDIVVDITKGTNQNMMYGKSGRRNSLGSYSPSFGSIKVRYAGDLDTTAHELGHALDDRFGLLNEVKNTALDEANMFSGHGSTPPKGHPNPADYVAAEGVAEWVRAFVVNPEEAIKQGPKIYEAFKKVVPEKVIKSFETFSNDVRSWAGATAKEQIMANVNMSIKDKEGLLGYLGFEKKGEGFSADWMDKFSRAWLDSLRVFGTAIEHAKGLKGVDELMPANNPMILARLLNGFDAKFGEIVKNGMVDGKNNVLKDKDGNAMNIDWLLSPLADKNDKGEIVTVDNGELDKRMNDLVAFMVAARTVEVASKLQKASGITGIGAGMERDYDVAVNHLKDFATLPDEYKDKIKTAASRYRAMSDAVLKYQVEKGRLANAVYDSEGNLVGGYKFIKKNNLYYVAMQRMQEQVPGEELDVNARSAGQNLTSATEIIKKIKGSTKAIQNPYASLLDNVHKGVRDADRNEILAEFRNLIYNPRLLGDGERKDYGDIGVLGNSTDKNTIKIFVKGKPEYWVFQNDVYNALKNLDSDGYKLPGVITALPKMLRWSVTHFPVFAARNVVRDFQSRIVLSNEGAAGSIKNTVTDKSEWEKTALFGGLNSGVYMQDKNVYYEMMNEAKDRLTKDGHFVVSADALKSGWHKYEALLYKSETFNRVAEYKNAYDNAKAKGMDEYNASLYAASKARETLDFAVAGHYMKTINQVIPFSNAAVQGLRSAAIKGSVNPSGFIGRVVLFTFLPQTAAWLLNHRDEETSKQYEALPDWQRDMFFNFKIGEKWLTIPKPYELGMFSSFIDRSLSYGRSKDTEAFSGFGKSVMKTTMPFDESSMAGPLETGVELATNYDFFRDKSIIPAHEEGLNLELRNTEGASRLGKVLGKITESDPRNVDFFIKNQFSYFGNASVKASNIGSETAKDKFGVSDLGFTKDVNAAISKPVTKFLEYAKEWNLTQSSQYRGIVKMELMYYKEKDPAQKKRIGEMLVGYSEQILKSWKEYKVSELKIKQKQIKDEQRH